MALNSRDEAPNRGSKATTTTTINQNAVPQPNSDNNTSRDSFLRGSGLSGEEFDRRLRIKSIDFVAKEALHFEFNLKATTTTTSSSSSSSLNKVEDGQPQLPTDPPPSEKYFVLVQLLTAQYRRAVQHLKERARRDEEEAEEQGTWPTNWSAVAVPCRVLKAHLPEELAPRAVLQRFLLCTDVGDLLVLNMPELVERLENGNGNGSNNKRSNVDMLSSKIATTSISPTTDSNNNDICGGGIITRAKAKALEFNRSSTGSMGSKKSGVEEEQQPFPPKPIQFSYFTLKLLDVYFTGPYRTNIYLEDQETQLEWRRLERLSSRRATPEQIRRRMPPRLMDKVVIDYPPPPEEEDDPDGSEIEASSKSFRLLPPPPPPPPPSPPLKPSDLLNSPTNTASQQPNSEATRWKLELFFRHHQYDPATGASRLQPPPYPLEELNPRRVALVAPPIFPASTTSAWGVFHQCQPSPAALELEYRLVMGALQRRKVELGEARAFTAARPLLQTLLHYRLGAPWEEVFERAARERSSGNLGGGPGPPVIPCQWLTDEHLPVAELPRTREAVQAAMTAATNYLFVVGSGYSCFNNNVGGPALGGGASADAELREYRFAQGTLRELFNRPLASSMFSELALIARKVAPAILRYQVLRIKLEEWEQEVLFKGPTTPSTGTSTSTTTTTPNGSSGPFSGPLFSSHLLNVRVRSPVPDQRFVGAFSPATAQVANSIMAMLAWSAKKKARPFVKFYKLYVPTLVGGDEEGNDGRGEEEPAAKRARNEEEKAETPQTTTAKSGENSATAVNSATTPRPSLVPSPSPNPSPGQCLLGSRSSPSSAALAQQLQASAQLIRQSNAKKRLLSPSPPPLHQVFVIAVEPQSEHLPTPPPIFLADPNFGHGSSFAEPSELTTLETARAGFSIQYRNGWPMLQFAEGHPLKEEMKKAVYQYYFQQKK